MFEVVQIKEFIGKTLIKISIAEDKETVDLEFSNGSKYQMRHEQDCCEIVEVEDVVGDLDALIGHPLLMAEETSRHEEDEDVSCTWTFYKFATIKGYVTIRWMGTSNGYYSEDVEIREVK